VDNLFENLHMLLTTVVTNVTSVVTVTMFSTYQCSYC